MNPEPVAAPALPGRAVVQNQLEASPKTAPAIRLDSVDLLRGLVMVLMALDHTRDFFFANPFDPLDLTQTFPALYFTRWITHFCAPVFVFLAGSGAFLQLYRGKPIRELSWFLLTRGFWLVVLEVTLVNWGWGFDLTYSFTVAQVIWAIGWCMMGMALLVHLPVRVVGLLGLAIIVFHNLLNPFVPGQFGPMAWLWMVLHEGGRIAITEGKNVFFAYPLLPWLGIMAAGYWFGKLVVLPEQQRTRTLLWLGLGLTAAFIALRYTNLYGDTGEWTAQKTPLFTLFSFMDVQKYPPSLLYTLATLGPAIMLLAVAHHIRGGVKHVLVVFGRVPLFYYLLHVPLIHGLAFSLMFVMHLNSGISMEELLKTWGFPLYVTYLVWALVVFILYWPCAWFAGVKMRQKRKAWLSYL